MRKEVKPRGKKTPPQNKMHQKKKITDEIHHVAGRQSPKPRKNGKSMKHDLMMTDHNLLQSVC
jgi:hypothetical protein